MRERGKERVGKREREGERDGEGEGGREKVVVGEETNMLYIFFGGRKKVGGKNKRKEDR